jgi:hypothetical protein
MGDDREERILTVAGLSAYVEPHGQAQDNAERRHVVLCRACGHSSPPLTSDQETDWFNRHAAEDREEHRRARAKR